MAYEIYLKGVVYGIKSLVRIERLINATQAVIFRPRVEKYVSVQKACFFFCIMRGFKQKEHFKVSLMFSELLDNLKLGPYCKFLEIALVRHE